MNSIFHVKNSYWTWFENETYFMSRLNDIFFVGFQETLSEDFSRLLSMLSLPSSVELPTDDVQTHANPSHLDTTISEEGGQNLKNWYKEEYRFIDLCTSSLGIDFPQALKA